MLACVSLLDVCFVCCVCVCVCVCVCIVLIACDRATYAPTSVRHRSLPTRGAHSMRRVPLCLATRPSGSIRAQKRACFESTRDTASPTKRACVHACDKRHDRVIDIFVSTSMYCVCVCACVGMIHARAIGIIVRAPRRRVSPSACHTQTQAVRAMYVVFFLFVVFHLLLFCFVLFLVWVR